MPHVIPKPSDSLSYSVRKPRAFRAEPLASGRALRCLQTARFRRKVLVGAWAFISRELFGGHTSGY